MREDAWERAREGKADWGKSEYLPVDDARCMPVQDYAARNGFEHKGIVRRRQKLALAGFEAYVYYYISFIRETLS